MSEERHAGLGGRAQLTIRMVLLVALVVATAAFPLAGADDELGTACFVAENVHHSLPVVDDPHTRPVANACWLVRGITGPIATETVPDPNDGIHPARACDAQPFLTYEFCVRPAMAGAEAFVYPTQVTLGCSTSCTYRPTYHVRVADTLAGDWHLSGNAHLRAVSGSGVGSIVSGSARSMTCSATGPGATCTASATGPDITAGNFNTYLFEGSWSLTWIDPSGAPHVMATGSDACYVAQYYNPAHDACEGN